MGQKIHPIGFRVGIIRAHDSHWIYPKSKYRHAVESDNKIRQFVADTVPKGLVSRVEIERAAQKVRVNIWTSRPGAIIGRGGKGVDTLTQELNKVVQKDDPTAIVHVNVDEVRQPELDAQLVAENIAVQLERRISHRRAMRQAITRVQRLNGRGVKILVSGRLNASDIARSEGDMIGKVPLHTIRADIDYGQATAATVAGSVGIKVWIYRGEILSPRDRVAEMPAPRRERRPRAPRGDGAPYERRERTGPGGPGGYGGPGGTGGGQGGPGGPRRDYSERPRGPRPGGQGGQGGQGQGGYGQGGQGGGQGGPGGPRQGGGYGGQRHGGPRPGTGTHGHGPRHDTPRQGTPDQGAPGQGTPPTPPPAKEENKES